MRKVTLVLALTLLAAPAVAQAPFRAPAPRPAHLVWAPATVTPPDVGLLPTGAEQADPYAAGPDLGVMTMVAVVLLIGLPILIFLISDKEPLF